MPDMSMDAINKASVVANQGIVQSEDPDKRKKDEAELAAVKAKLAELESNRSA